MSLLRLSASWLQIHPDSSAQPHQIFIPQLSQMAKWGHRRVPVLSDCKGDPVTMLKASERKAQSGAQGSPLGSLW